MAYQQAKGTYLSIPLGNTKLGNIPSFSTLAHVTCPGASDWCRKVCYAQKYIRQYKQTSNAYQRNTDARNDSGWVDEMVKTINRYAWPEFRIHVSGDFDSEKYVYQWIRIINSCPVTTFWVYTRSWSQPEILPALEVLKGLANVQVFASIDETMPDDIPLGWRVAYINTDARFKGMQCLEQRADGDKAKRSDCDACGYCQRKGSGNVAFGVH